MICPSAGTCNVPEVCPPTFQERAQSSCRRARGWWCRRPSEWTRRRPACRTPAACSPGPCKSWNLSQKHIWKEKRSEGQWLFDLTLRWHRGPFSGKRLWPPLGCPSLSLPPSGRPSGWCPPPAARAFPWSFLRWMLGSGLSSSPAKQFSINATHCQLPYFTFHSCPLVRSRDRRLWSETESAWAEKESKLLTMIFFRMLGSAIERYGVDMSYWPHTLPNLS